MYNEGNNIGVHLQTIKDEMYKHSLLYKVLILNDGSTDSSPAIVNQFTKHMPLLKVDHDVNKGLGTTFADLFREASKLTNEQDIIITMDSDSTHHPSYIPSLIQKIHEGYDVVIASRFATGGKQIGFATYRKLCSFGARILLHIVFHLHGVRDYTCGYRAYRAAVVKNYVSQYDPYLIESKGFPGVAEILIKMSTATPLKITEIPLVLRYDLKQSMSKMKLASTIREYLKLILITKFSKRRKQ